MKYTHPKKNRVIGLISAVSSEGEILVKRLRPSKKVPDNRPIFFSGKLYDKDIVYAISGIGKTNAAHAVTVLIENFSPSLILNFGIGGAYPSSGLAVGDIAVADKETYGDEGVLDRDGFRGTEFIGIPLLRKGGRRYFNEFPLDKGLVNKAVMSAKQLAPHFTLSPSIRAGTFVTVSACTGTKRRAKELSVKYNALCENMEGAAIAHICLLYGIPCVEIRGVSNIVKDRDTAKWDIRLAAENCQMIVMELLKVINYR